MLDVSKSAIEEIESLLNWTCSREKIPQEIKEAVALLIKRYLLAVGGNYEASLALFMSGGSDALEAKSLAITDIMKRRPRGDLHFCKTVFENIEKN